MAVSTQISVFVIATCLAATLLQPVNGLNVTWQFQQNPNSTAKVFREELQAVFGQPVIPLGEQIVFTWNEGAPHSLYQVTNPTSFANCTLDGVRLVSSSRTTATVTFNTTTAGFLYFFDDYSTNCASLQLKIVIQVLAPGATVATTTVGTTPATSVTTTTVGRVFVIIWHFGITQSDLNIESTDTVLFSWNNNNVQYALRRVAQAGYQTCNGTGGVDLATPIAINNYSITSWSIGTTYFLNPLPTHCSSGKMKVAINVIPGPVTWWVTVWSRSNTTDAVYITLMGNDAASRVWSSRREPLNAVTSGGRSPLTTAQPTTFSVLLRDVGTVSAVILDVLNATALDWGAVSIRLYKPAQANQPAKILQCAPNVINSTTIQQHCIVPIPVETVTQNTTTSTNTTSNSTGTTNGTDCSCFRQMIVYTPERRVLTCTSDGCFATSDNAQAGWADMSIKRLLGATNDTVFATNALNVTQQSFDGGVSWTDFSGSLPSFTFPVLQYTFDVANMTTVPLATQIFSSSDGSVQWGPSSQGVHFTTNGNWQLHALWACSCDGQCGLKCNQ